VVATHVEEQVSTTVEAPVVDKALVARLVAGARGQGVSIGESACW